MDRMKINKIVCIGYLYAKVLILDEIGASRMSDVTHIGYICIIAFNQNLMGK